MGRLEIEWVILSIVQSGNYNDKIVQCGAVQRTFFKVGDCVLHCRSVVFPTCASNQEMSQNFGEFVFLGMEWTRVGIT